MKAWFLCLIFLGGCASYPTTGTAEGSGDSKTGGSKHKNEAAGDSTAAKMSSTKDEYYLDLEKKVKKFHKTYFTSGLPSASLLSNLGRVGTPISDHVKEFVLYDLDTFNELDSFKPPQRCQLLLLLPKQDPNRETFITQVKKLASENTSFKPINATVNAGLTVRVDEDFKIKSFLLLKTFHEENFKKIMDSYISEYGYPVETKDIDGRQVYLWGMELDNQKYFLQISIILPSVDSKKENNKKFMSVRAYRKVDYTCEG